MMIKMCNKSSDPRSPYCVLKRIFLMLKIITGTLLLGFWILCDAKSIHFTSPIQQTTLIELYTSEGCSSCPPADAFLSQFSHSDGLWESYIPLAFHVDYWNYLGWKDQYAEAAYSDRQRTHRQLGNISDVYTPGFVINGSEWSGFFKLWRSLPTTEKQPGHLHIEVDKHMAHIYFDSGTQQLEYHMVIIGMGLSSTVRSGENAGHVLVHDFVVLDHQQQSASGNTTFNLPLTVKHQPSRFGIIAWVSFKNSLKPIQAAGGFLPTGTINQL